MTVHNPENDSGGEEIKELEKLILSSSRTVSETISQASRPTVNVIPVPMNDGEETAQEAPASSGNIAASPGIIASHNHDNPYILGALARSVIA